MGYYLLPKGGSVRSLLQKSPLIMDAYVINNKLAFQFIWQGCDASITLVNQAKKINVYEDWLDFNSCVS